MSLQNAILGLLSYREMTGYDLKLFFDASIRNIWPAHLSQIYRELGSLEENQWVASWIEPQEGRPDRKVYRITDKGKQALLEWLNKAPKSFISVARDETALRMFFGAKVEPTEIVFQLQLLLKEKKETILALDRIAETIKASTYDDEKFYWLLSLRKGYKLAQAEFQWAEECIRELQQRHS